jgi:carbonic anhydrase/acetyltransferase-like protein (isoleucine patch superfamily)
MSHGLATPGHDVGALLVVGTGGTAAEDDELGSAVALVGAGALVEDCVVGAGTLLEVNARVLVGAAGVDVLVRVGTDDLVAGATGCPPPDVVGAVLVAAVGRTSRYSAPMARKSTTRTSVEVRARPRWEGTADHQRAP